MTVDTGCFSLTQYSATRCLSHRYHAACLLQVTNDSTLPSFFISQPATPRFPRSRSICTLTNAWNDPNTRCITNSTLDHVHTAESLHLQATSIIAILTIEPTPRPPTTISTKDVFEYHSLRCARFPISSLHGLSRFLQLHEPVSNNSRRE